MQENIDVYTEPEVNVEQLRSQLLKRLPGLKPQSEVPVPNQEFWDWFRDNKSAFYDACFYVRKTDGNAWVIGCNEQRDKEAKRKQKLQEALENHDPRCERCGVHVDAINGRPMRNGVMRYKYFCKVCDCETGDGLPYLLVDHFDWMEKLELTYAELRAMR